jgi:hypothetical protein
MRGLKKEDTPILKGYQIYHNYIREDSGLDGKIPAEVCGIRIGEKQVENSATKRKFVILS